MNDFNNSQGIEELHWQLGLLQTLEVGLIVVDRRFRVKLWNSFMENYSGMKAIDMHERDLFVTYPELPADWLQRKLDTVFLLKNPAYISWEQRPFLLEFKGHRPITGKAPYMYQNVSLIPLTSPSGKVKHVGILIYDVTDVALGKMELEKLSRTDRLTGLYNRGFWEECQEAEFNRFGRSLVTSSLVMLDIDHFKKINDTYGHPAGDEVIRRLAAKIKEVARKSDIVGRYGGEEFGVVLIGTDAHKAGIFCERLRAAAEEMVIEHSGSRIKFTISLGISQLEMEIRSAEEWIKRADQALYYSKENGRNQYSTFIGSPSGMITSDD